MFCRRCGKQLSEDAYFCAYCGTKIPKADEDALASTETSPVMTTGIPRFCSIEKLAIPRYCRCCGTSLSNLKYSGWPVIDVDGIGKQGIDPEEASLSLESEDCIKIILLFKNRYICGNCFLPLTSSFFRTAREMTVSPLGYVSTMKRKLPDLFDEVIEYIGEITDDEMREDYELGLRLMEEWVDKESWVTI